MQYSDFFVKSIKKFFLMKISACLVNVLHYKFVPFKAKNKSMTITSLSRSAIASLINHRP